MTRCPVCKHTPQECSAFACACPCPLDKCCPACHSDEPKVRCMISRSGNFDEELEYEGECDDKFHDAPQVGKGSGSPGARHGQGAGERAKSGGGIDEPPRYPSEPAPERREMTTPEPPYPYFWRTQVQRAKEKAHRLMGELSRQAAKSSSWKQKFKSTRGTVPVMAKRIAELERALREKEAEVRDEGGDIIRACWEQLNPDKEGPACAIVALQMAERKVRRGTYSEQRARDAKGAK